MYVEETFYRRDEAMREARTLPAATYNLARTLLGRAPHGCLFVPIRSMQWLAVLDAEEIVFVDREAGRFIDIARREFRPQGAPVARRTGRLPGGVLQPRGRAAHARLQGEFHKASHAAELAHRQVTPRHGW